MWKQQIGKTFLVASKVGEVLSREKLQLTDYVSPNFFFIDKMGGETIIIKNNNIMKMEEIK
tara:strand:+ start:806 stop:988 length:183 start_codon:yes stop_codon:yes gene_type:complete